MLYAVKDLGIAAVVAEREGVIPRVTESQVDEEWVKLQWSDRGPLPIVQGNVSLRLWIPRQNSKSVQIVGIRFATNWTPTIACPKGFLR